MSWRLVFLVSVPVGLVGTIWSYRSLRDHGHPQAGPHRLVGQRHLRRRPGRRHGRHHLRHPALRRAHDGLDVAARAVDPARRRRRAGRFLLHRDAGRRPDVPARPVQDPRLRRRQYRHPARRDGTRWAAVHPDHLAAGHLAAAARLRLRAHAAVGRHLHAAADRRLPDRGARVGLPLRPLRRAAVRHRRAAGRGDQLRAAHRVAGQLRLRLVRADPAAQRHRHGTVLRRRTRPA